MPSLETSFGGLKLKGPLVAGSGSMTQEADPILRWLDEFDAVIPKTVAPEGCECVDPPVAWVPESGSVGKRAGGVSWNCEGISRYPLSRNLEIYQEVVLRRADAVLIGSVLAMAESRQSWEDVMIPLAPYVKAYELNVSCPQNVIERGAGAVIGRNATLLARVTAWAREIADQLGKPFSVKLTPMVDDVALLARVAAESGAHAVTCFNTYRGNLGFDAETRLPLPDARAHQGFGTNGATSGSSIHSISLEGVRLVARDLAERNLNVDILASGGIKDLRTAQNYILNGARLLQVYSALEPGIANHIRQALLESMTRHGDEALDDFRGSGLPRFIGSSELVAKVGGKGAHGSIAAAAKA